MHLGDLPQQRFTSGNCKLLRDPVHLLSGAFRKHNTVFFSELRHTADKLRARHDGSCGDSDIAFRFGPLLQPDAPATFQQGIFDQALISEFIRKRGIAFRSFQQQILKSAGMSPGKQTVQAPDLFIEIVVCLRTDCNHGKLIVHQTPYFCGNPRDHLVILALF